MLKKASSLILKRLQLKKLFCIESWKECFENCISKFANKCLESGSEEIFWIKTKEIADCMMIIQTDNECHIGKMNMLILPWNSVVEVTNRWISCILGSRLTADGELIVLILKEDGLSLKWLLYWYFQHNRYLLGLSKTFSGSNFDIISALSQVLSLSKDRGIKVRLSF